MASMLDRCAAALGDGREAALAQVEHRAARVGERAPPPGDRGGGIVPGRGTRVLIHGHDETVLEILLAYRDRLEAITVCEARPLNEGVRAAAALAERALPVRVITEAQLDLFVPECDLTVVAAERVLPDGSIVGRVGTAVISRICAAHGVQVYPVAERSRWVPERDERARFTRQRRPPSEICSQAIPGVEVVNIAFDLTLAGLLRAVLTEDGLVPLASAGALSSPGVTETRSNTRSGRGRERGQQSAVSSQGERESGGAGKKSRLSASGDSPRGWGARGVEPVAPIEPGGPTEDEHEHEDDSERPTPVERLAIPSLGHNPRN